MRTETMPTAFTEFRVELLDDIVYVIWEWQPEEGDGDHEILAEINLPAGADMDTVQRVLLNEGWIFRPGQSVSPLAEDVVGHVTPSTAVLRQLWEQADWALYRAHSQIHMANDALRTLVADRDEARAAVINTGAVAESRVDELLVDEVWE